MGTRRAERGKRRLRPRPPPSLGIAGCGRVACTDRARRRGRRRWNLIAASGPPCARLAVHPVSTSSTRPPARRVAPGTGPSASVARPIPSGQVLGWASFFRQRRCARWLTKLGLCNILTFNRKDFFASQQPQRGPGVGFDAIPSDSLVGTRLPRPGKWQLHSPDRHCRHRRWCVHAQVILAARQNVPRIPLGEARRE